MSITPPPQYGATLALGTTPLLSGYPTNITYADFTAAVDDMAQRGQRWVRFLPAEGELLDTGTSNATALVWQSARLAQYDAAIDYVLSKGLKLYLSLNLPISFTTGYTLADYRNVAAMFCSFLAQRWAGKVAVWQIINEANIGDYRGLGRALDAGYRAEFAGTLAVARTAIRASDAAPILTDLAASAGGALDSPALADLQTFLDAVSPQLDAIGLHIYDNQNAALLANAPSYLQQLTARYHLPLYISEFGNFSYVLGQATYTEQWQADSIIMQARAYAQANPVAIILYRWRDPVSAVLDSVVTNGGTGYATAPTVSFSGGGGSGAAATAVLDGSGHVDHLVITNTGSGYHGIGAAGVPTISFAGGGGAGAAAVALVTNENLGILNQDNTPKLGYAAFFAAQAPTAVTIPYRLFARPYIVLLDRNGNRPTVLNGVPVESALRGVTNLRYTPEGGVLDKIGSISFDAPPSDPINRALGPGVQIQIYDPTVLDATNAPSLVAWGVYNTGGRAVNRAGTTATFTFDDIMQELVRHGATSGFATAADTAGRATEGTTAILRRLVGQNVDTFWQIDNSLTTLDGLAFSVTGNPSIFAAASKRANECFAHVKRGAGRTLKFGRYGEDAGFVFRRATGDPTAAASDPATRIVDEGGLRSTIDGKIVNDIVPQGGDTGVLQLTLQPLYNPAGETSAGVAGWYVSGPVTFTGNDNGYPIHRRPRQDGGGLDGYDYYLVDPASIAAYGTYQGPFTKGEIVPIKNAQGGVAPADRAVAAAVLYQVAVAYLKWNAQPHEVLSITTPAIGDLRDVAGKTTALRYVDDTQGMRYDGTQRWVVMEVVRTVGNQPKDVFTLSSLGTYGREPAAIFSDMVTTVDRVLTTPVATRDTVGPIYHSDNADAGFPVSVFVPGNTGVQGILTARAWVTPSALRTEATPRVHVHTIKEIPHDIGNAGADVGLQATTASDTSKGGGFDFDPNVTLRVNKPVPGGAVGVSTGVVGDHVALYASIDGNLKASYQGFTTATSEHTHPIPPLTVTGNVAPTSGGQGGLTQAVTDPNELDAQPGMEHKMLPDGPVPTGLELWVDGVKVAGPQDTAIAGFSIFSAFAANPQADHTVEARCASLGHLTLIVHVERWQSSVGR